MNGAQKIWVRGFGCLLACTLLLGCGGPKKECEPGTEDITDAEASLVKGLEYHEASQTLTVQFVGSDRSIEYVHVPADVYESLSTYPSKGTFYVNFIRGQYPFLCP